MKKQLNEWSNRWLNEQLNEQSKGIESDVKTRWWANRICDQVTTILKEGVVSQIYVLPICYLIKSC